MFTQQLQTLAGISADPCVTFAFNTHRTHPDNATDPLVLRKLCHEAEQRLLEEFDKRTVAGIIEQFEGLQKSIDHNYNLDGMMVFVNNDMCEIVRVPVPVGEDRVEIGPRFSLRPLLTAANRIADYMILLLTLQEVKLYRAQNDTVLEEIRESGFPMKSHTATSADHVRSGDPRGADNLYKEFYNRVDKAVQVVFKEKHLPVVVCAIRDNYDHLMKEADNLHAYWGLITFDGNDTREHTLGKHGGELAAQKLQEARNAVVEQAGQAISQGNLITDTADIWRAAFEGRGDTLIVHEDFQQPGLINGYDIELTDDSKAPGVIDDVVSNIAVEVVAKHGRVIFTDLDSFRQQFGPIALVTRY